MIFEILQNIVQTKSAPNPDDMQNTGGDIMKKFAAVVKYKADDSIHQSIMFTTIVQCSSMVMKMIDNADKYTNTKIQIHKYKYAITNINRQIQIYKCK